MSVDCFVVTEGTGKRPASEMEPVVEVNKSKKSRGEGSDGKAAEKTPASGSASGSGNFKTPGGTPPPQA